jgi:hypothetical protein
MTHIVEIAVQGTTVPLTDVRHLPLSAVRRLAELPSLELSAQLLTISEIVQAALVRPGDWEAHLEVLDLETFTRFVSDWFTARHTAEIDLDELIAGVLNEEEDR